MTDRELLERALYVFNAANSSLYVKTDNYPLSDMHQQMVQIQDAISARIAEDDDEPVGYITYIEDAGVLFTQDEPEHGVYEPVYARPQTKKNS